MGTTPDRHPGPRQEEELILDDYSSDPSSAGGITYNSGSFAMQDSVGVFDPRSGSGISESQHRLIDQWVHFDLDEDCYYEPVYTGSKVTDEIWWTDSGKTQKIREVNYTFTGNKITTEVRKSYDSIGSLDETLTITYVYSGNKISNATYVRT